MTKANECTCPSGDGSLRHPCPAHPTSVELAGVAANLTFINGRPAMCGCQVEYSSGGGEYSDVIYVTLCAKHSGSAILDLVATNRIALTPEYEGQWHADLYLDREIPLAKAEGATPAEAVLALMSAERIDPEQESVEQAGGDERDLQGAQGERECGHAACKSLGEHHPFCKFVSDQDRAALAQPSPAPTLRAAIDVANDRFEVPVAKWGTDLAGEEERPEVMEAYAEIGRAVEDSISRNIPDWSPSDCPSEVIVHLINERDDAQTRVAELEAKLADLEKQESIGWFAQYCETPMRRMVQWGAKVPDCAADTFYPLYAAPVAQAQHSVPAYVSYTTQPAESLAGIALRQLKDESRWVEIRDINAHAFPDMQSHSYYPAGTVIKLPAAAPGKEVGHE
ncbi:TPA: LysM peptidoglycan-binding domain-containing protein [Pseudomonas aeruginosa]